MREGGAGRWHLDVPFATRGTILGNKQFDILGNKQASDFKSQFYQRVAESVVKLSRGLLVHSTGTLPPAALRTRPHTRPRLPLPEGPPSPGSTTQSWRGAPQRTPAPDDHHHRRRLHHARGPAHAGHRRHRRHLRAYHSHHHRHRRRRGCPCHLPPCGRPARRRWRARRGGPGSFSGSVQTAASEAPCCESNGTSRGRVTQWNGKRVGHASMTPLISIGR